MRVYFYFFVLIFFLYLILTLYSFFKGSIFGKKPNWIFHAIFLLGFIPLFSYISLAYFFEIAGQTYGEILFVFFSTAILPFLEDQEIVTKGQSEAQGRGKS